MARCRPRPRGSITAPAPACNDRGARTPRAPRLQPPSILPPRGRRRETIGRRGLRALSIAGVGLALATGSAAPASAREFCAERPGKATPPCVLEAGRAQVEVGLLTVTARRAEGLEEDGWLLGQAGLRLGVSARTEVQVTVSPMSVTETTAGGPRVRTTGVGDVGLGLRTSLTDPDRPGPAVALQAFASAPTATRGQGAGGWEGGVRLPLAGAMGWGLDLTGTPELALRRDRDGRGAHATVAGALAASHGWGPASLTAEVWAERDFDPARALTRASLGLSGAWMATPDVQLDGGTSLGLTRTTPDLEVSFGISRRF